MHQSRSSLITPERVLTRGADSLLAEPAPAGSLSHRLQRLRDLIGGHERVFTLLTLIALCFPIWFSLGDHGFNGRSDARYAVVAQNMAASNDWLVPRFMGEVHLTKPPLVYWLESASIELLGQTYFAVRLPSAICGTLAIVLLYLFSLWVASKRVALVACGLYAIMPMTIFPSRMSVTDSTLNLCWLMVIAGGYLVRAVPERRAIGRLLLWGGVAMGMLAKGPVMLIPIGVVLVWWGLSRGEPTIKRVKLGYALGAIVALLPLVAWGVTVLIVEPEAGNIWWHETFDRAVGQGDHSRPIWFFIPVLLAGCFPCSAMLTLPGVNLRLRDAWSRFRSGGLSGYLGFAAIGPFVTYSLISGKLPSYLLPICAPLALLSALMLERWFTEEHPSGEHGRKLPEVRVGLMIGTLLYTLGIGAALTWFFGFEQSWYALGLIPALMVSVVMVRRWRDRSMRVILVASFIAAWVFGWGVIEEIEDLALANSSYGVVEREAFGPSGWAGRVGVYQLEAGVIYWDRGGEIELYHNTEDLLLATQEQDAQPLLVLTRADRWEKLRQTAPTFFAQGRIVREWQQLPGAPMRYLVVYSRDEVQ